MAEAVIAGDLMERLGATGFCDKCKIRRVVSYNSLCMTCLQEWMNKVDRKECLAPARTCFALFLANQKCECD